MGNAEPPRSALYLLHPHGFGGQLIKNVMEIGAVGGIEPPLGTMPPLGIYRVSSQLLCKECCSLVVYTAAS